MPIMTIADPPISRDGPRWALLIPDARAAALFRATPRRNTDGPHLVSKARREVGRQFVSEDRQRSTDATNHLAATPETQSGRSGAVAPGSPDRDYWFERDSRRRSANWSTTTVAADMVAHTNT